MSRITGALGKGIATLTMDENYQKKRREALNKRPADLKEGLARGGKGLVMVRRTTFTLVTANKLLIGKVYMLFKHMIIANKA